MPRNTSMTLGEHFDAFVARQINQGHFASASEGVLYEQLFECFKITNEK